MSDSQEETIGDVHAMARQEWKMEQQNQKVLDREWCIVCGRSATEEHSARCHAAGGVLVGPFCSRWCAFAWLDGDWREEHEIEQRRMARRANA
jgi:hypothetical protein